MQLPRQTILIATLVASATLLGGVAAIAGGWGPPQGPMGASLLENFDTNDDGKLTQAEIDSTRQANLTKFDADHNGTLSLAEYQDLWADAMRRAMVRQFQANDTDGDGSITVEEFTVRFADVVADLDRNNDGVLTRDELRRPGHHGPHGPGRGEPGRGGPDVPGEDD